MLSAHELFLIHQNGYGGLHLFNPPEPHATPTRGTKWHGGLSGGGQAGLPCAACLSMPMYWKIKAPKLKGGPDIEIANRWAGEFILRKRRWEPSIVFPGNSCQFATVRIPKESWDKDYPWEEQPTWSMVVGPTIVPADSPNQWFLVAWPAGPDDANAHGSPALAPHIGNNGTTPATIKSRRFGCRDLNLFQIFNGDGSGSHPYRDDDLFVTAEPYWP